MNKGALIAVIVAVVLLGGMYLLFKNSGTQAPSTPSEDTTQSVPAASDTAQNESTAPAMDAAGAVKEVTVSGSPYKFEPATITVKKGDSVKLTFKNTAGTHNFVIDDLNVKTKTIPAGESDTVTFTADKAGSFEYYCAVGNHKAMGMKGILTVQ